jgi:tRNA threonylcarbamoyladenosine biosynthesis protein TsaE
MDREHLQITSYSVAETQRLGQIIGTRIDRPIRIALTGGLGSGKTAFVQGLAKGLDVSKHYYITSPSFTLINEYPGRQRLFHVDLYRIEHLNELGEIELQEVLAQDAVIAVEWAEKLSREMLSDHLKLQFKLISDDIRQIEIFAYGQQAGNLIKALQKINLREKRCH